VAVEVLKQWVEGRRRCAYARGVLL